MDNDGVWIWLFFVVLLAVMVWEATLPPLPY